MWSTGVSVKWPTLWLTSIWRMARIQKLSVTVFFMYFGVISLWRKVFRWFGAKTAQLVNALCLQSEFRFSCWFEFSARGDFSPGVNKVCKLHLPMEGLLAEWLEWKTLSLPARLNVCSVGCGFESLLCLRSVAFLLYESNLTSYFLLLWMRV